MSFTSCRRRSSTRRSWTDCAAISWRSCGKRAAVRSSSFWRFLITRIMERGTLKDVMLAWAFYGEDRVREALVSARALSRKTISFLSSTWGHPGEYRTRTRTQRRGTRTRIP
ncbi:DUF6922 domain-containing protein [Kiritimatiella glycovorans]|uniref:DUF6922 domain-containing protein n=1 Tax=Kiritimatiella glycovorans TaxID=1307763 RepID=UPI003AAA8CB5